MLFNTAHIAFCGLTEYKKVATMHLAFLFAVDLLLWLVLMGWGMVVVTSGSCSSKSFDHAYVGFMIVSG